MGKKLFSRFSKIEDLFLGVYVNILTQNALNIPDPSFPSDNLTDIEITTLQKHCIHALYTLAKVFIIICPAIGLWLIFKGLLRYARANSTPHQRGAGGKILLGILFIFRKVVIQIICVSLYKIGLEHNNPILQFLLEISKNPFQNPFGF